MTAGQGRATLEDPVATSANGPSLRAPQAERPLCARSGHSITAHFANEPSPSDQAPPMQRAVINQLSNGIALPNRSCIVQCRRKSRKIVALVPRERLEPPTSFS